MPNPHACAPDRNPVGLLSEYGVHAPSRVRIPPSPFAAGPRLLAPHAPRHDAQTRDQTRAFPGAAGSREGQPPLRTLAGLPAPAVKPATHTHEEPTWPPP